MLHSTVKLLGNLNQTNDLANIRIGSADFSGALAGRLGRRGRLEVGAVLRAHAATADRNFVGDKKVFYFIS